MLYTTYPQIVSVLLSIVAIFLATRGYLLIRTAYANIEACIKWVQSENEASASLRRMAEVEGTLTDLMDSYNSLLEQHKRLRSRIGMRELRARRAEEDDPAPPQTPDLLDAAEKAAYKSRLRADLRAKGQLR